MSKKNLAKIYSYNAETGKLSKTYSSVEQAINNGHKDVRRALKYCYKDRGYYFSLDKVDNYNKVKKVVVKKETQLPKILILDIETSPIKAFVWSTWKQNINSCQMITDWFILTLSYKWLFDEEIHSERLTGSEAKSEDDSRILKKFWKVLNEADIVIAHNGNAFDLPKIYARFILNGLPPVGKYKSIDTCLIARSQFGFTSNKLDDLAKLFGVSGKTETSFQLWRDCLDGKTESLKYMEEYNRNDVQVLEDVYLRLRPWIRNHPNVGVYVDSETTVCGNCGCNDLKKNGYYYTTVNKYPVYRCNECGALNKVRKSTLTKDKKKSLIVSL